MFSNHALFAGIFFFNLNAFLCSPVFQPNDRPIIGVVQEEASYKFRNYGTSAITASYVKFLEFAGARVVPIKIFQPLTYYEDIFSKINGVLFPGDGNILRSDGYGRTGRILFDLAVKANDDGDYFPIWGTCLGFELLNYVAANQTLWMKACAAEDLASSLTFLSGYNESRMFHKLEDSLMKLMQNNEVTINYHQWCITPQNFSLSGLDQYFNALSLSKDSRGLTYISAVEDGGGASTSFWSYIFGTQEGSGEDDVEPFDSKDSVNNLKAKQLGKAIRDCIRARNDGFGLPIWKITRAMQKQFPETSPDELKTDTTDYITRCLFDGKMNMNNKLVSLCANVNQAPPDVGRARINHALIVGSPNHNVSEKLHPQSVSKIGDATNASRNDSQTPLAGSSVLGRTENSTSQPERKKNVTGQKDRTTSTRKRKKL